MTSLRPPHLFTPLTNVYNLSTDDEEQAEQHIFNSFLPFYTGTGNEHSIYYIGKCCCFCFSQFGEQKVEQLLLLFFVCL